MSQLPESNLTTGGGSITPTPPPTPRATEQVLQENGQAEDSKEQALDITDAQNA